MEINQKNILLVSYVFPPYPGVGSRRWVKFSKYLAQKGFIVHVICSKNPFEETSLFTDDVKHPNIRLYELAPSYPSVLLKDATSLFDRVNYRISLIRLKLSVKGNYYDRGVFWKQQLLKLATGLIHKNRIRNVIVTGAPFSLLHHALELKKSFPDITLIGDMRDPWTWGSGYGMQSISQKRKTIEHEMEKEVIEKYDRVLVPSDEMKNHLVQHYPVRANKILLLPHGVDTAEVQPLPKSKSNKTRLLFYGTIYSDIGNAFQKLAEFISTHPTEITLDIYSPSKRYSDYFNKLKLLNAQVNYNSPLAPKQLFNTFSNYDYVLVIQPDFATDHITTKIYEVIYSKTPIILISSEGKLSRFITENNVGIHILPSQLEEGMTRALKQPPASYSLPPFSINDYSFECLTEHLIRCFN